MFSPRDKYLVSILKQILLAPFLILLVMIGAKAGTKDPPCNDRGESWYKRCTEMKHLGQKRSPSAELIALASVV
ncbi:hypothetical protein SASPL_147991 [Salvia splendens]|uniref:Uncharacterized protein n=1 Tax=Salvia splendens TaxID=180675 RepID=A0A8X8W9F5_SALSN|nr:hypothetical protein SASPL_147991 [Salvia splendens]